MIDTGDILDLSEDELSERSNDEPGLGVGWTGRLDRRGGVSDRQGGECRSQTPSAFSRVSAHDGELADMTFKEEPNAGSLLDSDYKDVKVGFEEPCPVCGDKVSGYHYGLLTCESCKGFFKRTVQNQKVYSCVDNRTCQIDKSQRKRCPYCRFQKCLNVGMKLEAVRSDRMRGGRNKFGPMYKRDRALKQQAARQAQSLHGSCVDISLLSNGMMASGIPESPEDVKPDPIMLQASLNLYTGASSTPATSNAVSGIIPGLPPCLSTSAVALSSTSTVRVSASSSPPPPRPPLPSAHSHHILHTGLQQSHQNFVPVSVSPPNLGHTSTMTISQPPSPKPLYTQPHYLGGSHHHLPHHHSSHLENGPLDCDNPGLSSHHQRHQQIPSQSHALSDYHLVQDLYHIQHHHHHNNNSSSSSSSSGNPLSDVHTKETNYCVLSEAHPKIVEALKVIHDPVVTYLSERSLLSTLITEIKANMVDETEVKQKMLSFMQNELSHSNAAVSTEILLQVLCRMVDQLLFLMVEWARNSSFFKEIQVEDQMKLLHNCWSEILILDFIYRQIHYIWGREFHVPNGDIIGYELFDKLGLGDVKTKVLELIKKGRELKMDYNEYMCLKFLILLNPDVSSLENRAYIEQSQERVNASLFEYCAQVYPDMSDRFSQLLLRLPEIRLISIRLEDFLYFKHLSNEVPDQTLLTEMLHAKKTG